MTYEGIDTAANISASAAKKLKGNGISFVGRYLVPTTMSKSLKADEIKGLRDAGLAILLCWEIGASDVKGGAERGKSDGARAKELALSLGVPAGTAIYFAVDYEAVQAEFPTIEAYIRAAGEACYPYAAGMYCHAALADYLGSKGACKYFWQCCAWSYGRVSAYMSAYQYAWSGAAESKAMAAAVGIPAVDMDSAESLEAAGLWLPPVTEYDDDPAPEPSHWYDEAMAWAKDNGLINDGRPNDPVTRAELATVMQRYDRLVDEKIKLRLPEDDSFGGIISD
jgi:hypothetical protein